STRLCTPCQSDSECSAASRDLCLADALGRKFCARDCSTIACPSGYSCQTLMVGTSTFHQCTPLSGFCDCNASNMGATQPCTIQTPFNPCMGTRTCNGATGWGACQPPSQTDVPDGNYQDDNCDGIDGDINGGIFVAPTGGDSVTCGLTYMTPCQTISHAILRAVQTGRRNVYVQAGVYDEVVTLQSGVHIWGGYDTNWQRASRSTTGHEVRIRGGFDSVDAQYMTIKAHNLIVPTTVADLVIQGPTSTGAAAGSARSTYAVHADGALLDLVRVTVQAGNGARGGDGMPGQDAPNVSPTVGMQGGQGGPAERSFDLCDNTTRGLGGGAGTNACLGGGPQNGERGGDTGTKDRDCCAGQCAIICGDCSATPGFNGADAAFFVVGSDGFPGGGAGATVT